ncbi:MAG: glycosyltransferase [Verrucomicrobiota bacterium]
MFEAQPAPARISVLIPAYNEEALIAKVLARVHGCFEAVGCPQYEVIVCDNNSNDRTAELAAASGAMVVKEPHNQIARARNTAAKAATGEWFIFLDADTLLTAELLAETIRSLQSGAICGGGSILQFDRQDLGLFAAALTRVWNTISSTFHLAAGSYLFCYRRAWEELGGFDESVYAGEEIYFSRELKRWARANDRKFRVITRAPVVTSARKMEWYSQRQLLWRVLMMARPGAVKHRDKCDLWYSRP